MRTYYVLDSARASIGYRRYKTLRGALAYVKRMKGYMHDFHGSPLDQTVVYTRYHPTKHEYGGIVFPADSFVFTVTCYTICATTPGYQCAAIYPPIEGIPFRSQTAYHMYTVAHPNYDLMVIPTFKGWRED